MRVRSGVGGGGPGLTFRAHRAGFGRVDLRSTGMPGGVSEGRWCPGSSTAGSTGAWRSRPAPSSRPNTGWGWRPGPGPSTSPQDSGWWPGVRRTGSSPSPNGAGPSPRTPPRPGCCSPNGSTPRPRWPRAGAGAAFEDELGAVGVGFPANEASTGRTNGYRFADPAHRGPAGEPVWSKASQLGQDPVLGRPGPAAVQPTPAAGSEAGETAAADPDEPRAGGGRRPAGRPRPTGQRRRPGPRRGPRRARRGRTPLGPSLDQPRDRHPRQPLTTGPAGPPGRRDHPHRRRHPRPRRRHSGGRPARPRPAHPPDPHPTHRPAPPRPVA